jgi:hypothetical protein
LIKCNNSISFKNLVLNFKYKLIIFISIVLEKNQLRKGIEFLIKFEYYSLEFGKFREWRRFIKSGIRLM